MPRHPALGENGPIARGYDVIVFGGGPAGAAAAIALARKGLQVAVLAQARHAGPPVGETVSPTIRRPLSRLGLWDTFIAANHLAAPGTVAIWGDERGYENDFILSPYGSGWHLDRARFDTMLMDAARASGADIYDGTATDCVRADSQTWCVSIAQATAALLRARWVIDATGRAAWLAQRQAARRRRLDRLVALVRFATIRHDGEPRTLIESCPTGWWYAAALPERRVVAAYFTDSDLLPRGERGREQFWHEMLAGTVLVRSVMPAATESSVHTAAACTGSLDRSAGENWLAIGDAAQTYDPLSGQGIEKALTSALTAAEVIAAARAGDGKAFDEFAQVLQTDFQKYRHARVKHYRRENRWPAQAFWQRRHRSMALTEMSD